MSIGVKFNNNINQNATSAAIQINLRITPKTTETEFATLIQGFSSYEFSHVGNYGWTAFATAASFGNTEVINFLFRKKPQLLEQPNFFKWTPILCALKYDQLTAAYHLAELGANVNVKSKFYYQEKEANILNIILNESSVNEEVLKVTTLPKVKFLLKKGAVCAPSPDDEQSKSILSRAESELNSERQNISLSIALVINNIFPEALLTLVHHYV
ncbi:MAG TPA: ankyrin repeat domain-containing protein [Rhabdochlamydiaceae bacterium]|jgi:ankyrin repeat protein